MPAHPQHFLSPCLLPSQHCKHRSCNDHPKRAQWEKNSATFRPSIKGSGHCSYTTLHDRGCKKLSSALALRPSRANLEPVLQKATAMQQQGRFVWHSERRISPPPHALCKWEYLIQRVWLCSPSSQCKSIVISLEYNKQLKSGRGWQDIRNRNKT